MGVTRLSRLNWYPSWMSPAEVAWRIRHHAIQQAWRRRQLLRHQDHDIERGSSQFADVGVTLLRASRQDSPEIWCRCDGGPYVYLSIAAHAHAHADALSVEIRYAGADILADPGTYCYHAELSEPSQPGEGPFPWPRHARAREIEVIDDGDIASWAAEHDGYASLHRSALHRRSVLLDRASRSIDIVDMMEGDGHTIRLAFHLGPYVQAELGESCAMLNWPTAPTPAPGAARLELPPGLRWSLHRGETDPVLGWYAPGLGLRVPAFTLLGRGRFLPGMPLITRLEFLDGGKSAKSAVSQHAVSWTTSVTSPDEALEIRMEAR
jgi:heparinase II/III-like protein